MSVLKNFTVPIGIFVSFQETECEPGRIAGPGRASVRQLKGNRTSLYLPGKISEARTRTGDARRKFDISGALYNMIPPEYLTTTGKGLKWRDSGVSNAAEWTAIVAQGPPWPSREPLGRGRSDAGLPHFSSSPRRRESGLPCAGERAEKAAGATAGGRTGEPRALPPRNVLLSACRDRPCRRCRWPCPASGRGSSWHRGEAVRRSRCAAPGRAGRCRASPAC